MVGPWPDPGAAIVSTRCERHWKTKIFQKDSIVLLRFTRAVRCTSVFVFEINVERGVLEPSELLSLLHHPLFKYVLAVFTQERRRWRRRRRQHNQSTPRAANALALSVCMLYRDGFTTGGTYVENTAFVALSL